jgi:chromosome partitioning protein
MQAYFYIRYESKNLVNEKYSMIISIVNHKGGTGKTTTTINLGSALAAQGQRVLLVDFDAQGSLTYSLGINAPEFTITDALLGEATIADALHEREGMDVLPANETLADAELSIARSGERFNHLKALLRPLQEYDFILIDCPPSLSLLTLNALIASDHLIVAMQMDVLALRGLDSILSIVDQLKPLNENLSVLGILAVMVDTRKNMHLEIISHIKSNYQTSLFKQSIRSCVKAAEAPSFGRSVVQHAPSSRTAQDYIAFSNEIRQMVLVHRKQFDKIEQV